MSSVKFSTLLYSLTCSFFVSLLFPLLCQLPLRFAFNSAWRWYLREWILNFKLNCSSLGTYPVFVLSWKGVVAHSPSGVSGKLSLKFVATWSDCRYCRLFLVAAISILTRTVVFAVLLQRAFIYLFFYACCSLEKEKYTDELVAAATGIVAMSFFLFAKSEILRLYAGMKTENCLYPRSS